MDSHVTLPLSGGATHATHMLALGCIEPRARPPTGTTAARARSLGLIGKKREAFELNQRVPNRGTEMEEEARWLPLAGDDDDLYDFDDLPPVALSAHAPAPVRPTPAWNGPETDWEEGCGCVLSSDSEDEQEAEAEGRDVEGRRQARRVSAASLPARNSAAAAAPSDGVSSSPPDAASATFLPFAFCGVPSPPPMV